ncbi:MAG: lipid-A-disaccharide synthase [Bacteroidales bacterium]|nr:lipid-A-disaccharide synthase [Bacteroidales bacterium]
MKYYIIAGEASGDLHGSNLIQGLKQADPGCDIRFWGGDLMAAAGGTMVHHYKDSAVMGIVEVVRKAGTISRNMKKCKSDIISWKPDAVILIDYPGFNFRIAKFAKSHGFKTFYYIAPKVWAWMPWRVKRLQRDIDKLFIIFPFEKEYFAKRGIDAIYEGNPLIDSISHDESQDESDEFFYRRCDLRNAPSIALLAGSRKMEISYLMPEFVKLEQLLKGTPFANYQLLLAAAPSIEPEEYTKYLPEKSRIRILYGETYRILRHSSAALINSGTASLEAALIGVPQVVCYGMNPLTYLIAKTFVKIRWISLANIILEKFIFKELIQNECTAENMLEELKQLISDKDRRAAMESDYRLLRDVLGGEGASVRVAARMVEETKKR